MKSARYVLVIQPDYDRRETTRLALEAGHLHVTAVADGVAALALCARAGRPYDAIVLDLGLPGLSGPEVAHRLRALAPATPIVAIAPDEPGHRRRATLARWFDACLVEPLARTQLLEAVTAVATDVDRPHVG